MELAPEIEKPANAGFSWYLAEREVFEPPIRITVQRISSLEFNLTQFNG